MNDFNNYSKKLLATFSVLLFVVLITDLNRVSADAKVSNNLIEYSISQEGRFSIGTTGGSVDNYLDDYKKLLYGHPNPGTSYTTVNIDGLNHIFSSDNQSATDPLLLSSTSSQILSNVNVRQQLRIVRNFSTGREDTVEIKYSVENNDTIPHNVGLRVMMDTMLGNNDAAPFRIPGIGEVTTEREFLGASIPQYWQAFDNLVNPTVTAQVTLFTLSSNKPDKVQFTNWGNVYNTNWNYIVRPYSSNGDSAVEYYLGDSEGLESRGNRRICYLLWVE